MSLAFLSITGDLSAAQTPASKIDGFAIAVYNKGEFASPGFSDAVTRAKSMGADWVGIHATFFQDGMRGTEIFDVNPAHGNSTPGVEEQRTAVRAAHRAGLKVLLKPHVNLRSGEGWRGDIGTDMTQDEVGKWFASYGRLLLSHAKMAEEEHVEMLAVGTELTCTQGYESHWRELIAKVRGVYSGPLVYCANHSEETKMKWWDALDLIGIDAYYPLSEKKNPGLDELKAAWKPYLESCEALSRQYGRKILFAELGYMSRAGTSTRPYDWTIPPEFDTAEQASCYQAFFETVYEQDWLAGVVWWSLTIHKPGTGDTDYTPEGKPAEALVRKWFGGAAEPAPAP